MSTPVFVDPKISNQADGAQSSRVPVSLPKDPYEAIRQAYLVRTDAKSEHFKDPVETGITESPHTIAPPTCHVEESEGSGTTARMAVRVPPMMSPSFSVSIAEVASMPDLAFCKRGQGPTIEDEDPAAGDEGLAARDEGPHMGVKTVGEPLELGYGALRCREISLGEDRMPSLFEVGQSSGFIPESERPKRVSALRQPTLTTWINPKDAPSISPSPISSPMISLTVPSLVASPVTTEAEGFLAELGAQATLQRELQEMRGRITALE
nr:hypothetical protein [Tanacetum cinerariifolium]